MSIFLKKIYIFYLGCFDVRNGLFVVSEINKNLSLNLKLFICFLFFFFVLKPKILSSGCVRLFDLYASLNFIFLQISKDFSIKNRETCFV